MNSKLVILLFSIFPFLFSCSMIKKEEGEFPQTIIENLDSVLVENSGMIYWDKLFWTFNDSGGENKLYAFDKRSGKVVKMSTIINAENKDWEDIAQDENYIYIAEFGNNFGNRKDLQVLRILKKDILKSKFSEVKAQKIYFSYSGQKAFTFPYKGHGFDAEALMVWKGNLYLFSKDWAHMRTTVYSIPNVVGRHVVSPMETFDVKGLVTGADINEKGELALVGYANYKSFVWLFDVDENSFFNNPRFIDLSMLENAQTEGVCYDEKGNLFISCEETQSYPPKVWKVDYRIKSTPK